MIAALAILALTALSAAAYVAPLLIALIRRAPDVGAVAVINILLGWTFAGWVVALAMALRSADPGRPAVQIVQNLPDSRPPELGGVYQPWAAPPLMLPPPPAPDPPQPSEDPGSPDWGQPS
jgi:hypothetical protein